MSRAPLMLILAASTVLLAGCPGPKGPTPPPAYVPKERITEDPAPIVASVSEEQTSAKSTSN
jgi:hypothetical protein